MNAKKLAAITAKLQNDKKVTDIESFISDAQRWLKAIKEGRVICSIVSVSNSGMSRIMRFNAPEFNKYTKRYQYLNFNYFFKQMGFTEIRAKWGFRIYGCGMDMVFYTNYTIIHRLHQLGFITRKECDKLAQMTPSVI